MRGSGLRMSSTDEELRLGAMQTTTASLRNITRSDFKDMCADEADAADWAKRRRLIYIRELESRGFDMSEELAAIARETMGI